MRRNLLNEIFKRYPLLGNIDKLFELDIEELKQIVSAADIEEAREVFRSLIENKETCDDENKSVKKNVLLKDTIYYMNY